MTTSIHLLKHSPLQPAIAFSNDRKLISCAPYPITWETLKEQFATNAARHKLALRFEKWIADCSAVVNVSTVWVGGSFCSGAATPKDIDAVLFYRYPTHMPLAATRDAFLQQHKGALSNPGAKLNYGIDSAIISLELDATHLITLAARWAMILSNGPGDTRRAFYSVSVICR